MWPRRRHTALAARCVVALARQQPPPPPSQSQSSLALATPTQSAPRWWTVVAVAPAQPHIELRRPASWPRPWRAWQGVRHPRGGARGRGGPRFPVGAGPSPPSVTPRDGDGRHCRGGRLAVGSDGAGLGLGPPHGHPPTRTGRPPTAGRRVPVAVRVRVVGQLGPGGRPSGRRAWPL